MKRLAPRLALSLVSTLVISALLLLVDYALFWRPFVEGLREMPREEHPAPRYVDEATMRLLGSLRADRAGAFTRFAFDEPEGTIRVCTFGDSFTYGDEVAEHHDYPSFLQQLFDRRGVSNVQVLNFGNNNYGAHQAFILWQRVGRHMGCDFVLLGPECFYSDRDTEFNHTRLAHPYYLHARYVPDGDDWRLLEVIGDTPEERLAAYFGFIPSWQYLRYDRNAPAFIQALMPDGFIARNPFYYASSSADDEALATYATLLRKMSDADSDVQILLLHSRPEVVAVADRVDRPNLSAVQAVRREQFPLAAPGGHFSAFGNRLMAERYFAHLTQAYDPVELTMKPLLESDHGSGAQPGRPLSYYDRIEFRIAGEPVGCLVTATHDPAKRRGAPGDFHGSKVTTLLALVEAGQSLATAAFVPLARPASAAEPLVLRLGSDRFTLGRVRALGSSTSLAVAEVAGFDHAGGLSFYGNDVVPRQRLERGGADVAVLLGDEPILTGTSGGDRVDLTPVGLSVRHVRVLAGHYVDLDRLPATGLMTMAMVGPDATTTIPVARWTKTAAPRVRPVHEPSRTIDVRSSVAKIRRRIDDR